MMPESSSPIPSSEQDSAAAPGPAGLVLLAKDTSASDSPARNPRKGLKRFSNKVRTGCITCKIRRVKCDEAKPACLRCRKTGRVCDGYQVEPDAAQAGGTFASSNHQRIGGLLAPADPPGYVFSATSDWPSSERRALDFYLKLSVPGLFSGVTGSFWGRVIPALCQQEPAIRHAVFAVSSLHESLFYRPRIVGPSANMFAAVQYGKALRYLQNWQFPQERNLAGTASAALPLVACALFICIELMQGNSAAALIHISQGRRILARLDANALASPAAELMRREIAPIFSKLSVAAFMFGAAPEPIPSLFRWTTRRGGGSMDFASLAEAEQAMFELVDDGLRFAKEARFSQHRAGFASPPGDAPTEEFLAMQDQREQLLAQLRKWCSAFEALKASSLGSINQVSLVYCRTVHVIVGMALDRREMCYDDYATEFASIVILGKQILDEEDAKNAGVGRNASPTSLFTFDSGLIPPLYFTVLKSRHPGLRRDALTLLERHSALCHRENLWDSRQAFRVAERMVTLEEMRGWRILDRVDPVGPSPRAPGKQPLHEKKEGEVSVDWMPSLFDQNGKLKVDADAYMLRIQPEPRPISSDQTAPLPDFADPRRARDFSELRGLFSSPEKRVHLALAQEAWAALTAASPLRFQGSAAGGVDMARSWASIYDVPACLHIPQEARIHNAVVDPQIEGGSWTSFFVEPDPDDTSRVGVLREFIRHD